MPKIPKYNQPQLASSVVGTPGVDTSVTGALSNLQTGLNRVGGAVYNSLENDYVLNQRVLRAQQAEQRRNERQLKTLYDEGIVAKGNSEAEIAANDIANKVKQKYGNDITGAREEFDTQINDLITTKVDGYTDPKQRAMMTTKLEGLRTSQTRQMGDWITGQMPVIAKANATQLGDALKLSVNNADLSGTQVLQKLQEFEADPDKMKVYQVSGGNAWQAEVRKKQSDAARAFLSTVANTGDEKRLQTLINDKRFDKYILGSDKEVFYSRQRALASATRTQQNIDNEIEDTEQRTTVSKIVLSRDDNDLGSLKTTRKELEAQYATVAAQPASKRSKETLGHIENELQATDKKIADFAKNQRQESQELERQRNIRLKADYDSNTGIDARATIQATARDIDARMKAEWKKNPAAASAEIRKFQNLVTSAAKAHYLDTPGSKAQVTYWTGWIKTKLNEVKSKPAPRSLLDQAIQGIQEHVDGAFQFFSNPVPASGKTSKQTTDALGTAYQDELQKGVAHYKSLRNKQPSPAVMRQLDAQAKANAYQRIYGHKPR